MNDITYPTVGAIVADDYRTAAVFSKYGIDFCCKGHRSIDQACAKKGIELEQLLAEIETVLSSDSPSEVDFKSWPLDLLIDYIEKTHHRYVTEQSQTLLFYLDKLCKVHGQRHPELLEIALHFKITATELAQHMKKEELILFPFIKKMLLALQQKQTIEQPAFLTVENPISQMKDEHDNEGTRFDIIAKLTHQYTPPTDACETYRVTFALLADFEKDLHKHIHLENNIVFPKAIELESHFTIV